MKFQPVQSDLTPVEGCLNPYEACSLQVDGDALMKSSLSDLVNVVGLEYSPAVRVIFLVQQIKARDTTGKGGNCGD